MASCVPVRATVHFSHICWFSDIPQRANIPELTTTKPSETLLLPNKIEILLGIKKRASDVKSKTLLLLRFISLLYIGCSICWVAYLRSDQLLQS